MKYTFSGDLKWQRARHVVDFTGSYSRIGAVSGFRSDGTDLQAQFVDRISFPLDFPTILYVYSLIRTGWVYLWRCLFSVQLTRELDYPHLYLRWKVTSENFNIVLYLYLST